MSGRPELSSTYKDPHDYPPGIAYADGQYLRIKDAKILMLDCSFIRTDATYDVVHV